MQNRLLPLLMSFVCLLYIPGAYDSLKHILSRQATVMIWLSIVVFVAVVAGYGFLPFFLSGYLPSHFSGLTSSWTWKRPLFIEDINYCLPKNGIQIAVSKFLWFGVLNQDLIGTEEHKKAGWCGIGIYGLKLKLPVSFLQAQRQKPASTTLSETSTPTPTTPKLSRSNDATRKNRDLEKDEDIAMQTHLRGRRRSPLRARMNMMKRHLRYAIPRRILRFANWLGRTFAFVLGWFSFELVDFSLEVEGLGTLVIEKARIGVELKRSKENHVMGWLKLEGVKVVECATTTKAICFNLPRWVKLEFTAPLDPTVGLGGLFTPAGLKPASVNVNLEFGKQPFEIQVDKVKKALEAFGEKMESLVGQSAAVPLLNSLQLPTPKVSDAKQDRLSKASDASFETIWEDEDLLDQSTILQEATKRHQPLPPKHLRNFLRAIREVQLKLPRINLFVSHYPSADPLPESAWPRECPRPELPRSIEFRVEGDGIALVLRRGVKVKGSAQGEWFGGEDILTTVDASMSSVEVRLSLDDKPESDSFHLGSSSFSLSSNWFPTQMKRFFAPTERTQQEPLFQGDPNSHLIVGELEVGTMSGKCNMQELEAVNWGLAVRSYRYKARRQERDAGRQSEGDAHPAHLTPTLAEELLAGLPRIIGCVKLNTFSYTVIGRDEWRGDRLHISLSESTFNVQTSYRDSFARSVMNHDGSTSRSEASKKAVPKAVRVKRFSAVDFHDKRHHTLMYRVDGEVTIGLFSVSMEALPIAPRTEQRSYFQTRRHRSKQDILTFGPLEYRVFQDITGWEELYLQLTNVDLVFRKPAHPKSLSELNLKCTTALLAGFSPTVSEGFDDLIRTHDLNIRLQQQVLKFDASVIRLRIPYKFILADSIEAIVNMVKCIKQMSQRVFNKRQNWTIDPIPEVPKKVPRIDVNIPTVILEFEDDPFENALNIIWQAGFQEQRARSARAEQLHECLRQLESWYPQDFDKGKLRDEHWREEFDLKAAEDNARTWKARVDRMRQQQDEGDIKPPVLKLRAKADVLVPMRKPPRTTPLARLTVTDFAPGGVGVDGFLHEVGKGMPADTLFNLVIPFHLDWSASSVTCTLRDFPLPLLEIPSTGVLSTPAWELSTDFVIAEEHGPPSSVRWASSTIVPASGCTDMRDHSMKVPRTAMPTKTYMVPSVRVNSKNVTRIGWGNSMHPTIQDVVRVLDSLTHASPDQSEKLAFWDKIRLVLHWRVEIKFAGPVYLHLKGSRDPYHLSGFGAGFVLAWMDDTIIRLGQPDSLKKHHEFLEVQSDRFVLAIPDLSHYSKGQSGVKTNPLSRERDDHRVSISPSASSNEDFGLVCLRLIGGVRWGMGVVPERSTFHRQCRLFHFKPHYRVVTSTQSLPSGFDSFQSFRSDFIHFSISLSALKGTAPNPSDRTGENNCQYNALHLTPEGMTHFFAWWKLFDGTLSLPIRQGSKFPGSAESAKFGRHCGTIKYSFRLAPIFVSHTFRQEDDKDWAQGVTTVLGLKGRMESLRVDLHQRMQEECVHREARKEHRLTCV
ncbi:hypothetical protein BT69DRAFT_1329595 [Atractiella rhizophila]|nr:hypothetical protein BT69DRAFT_1329595 [Atractiella rhizophila]